jgi:hypothetical protein
VIGLLVGGPTERACYETLTKKLGVSADVRMPGRPGGEDRLLDPKEVLTLIEPMTNRRAKPSGVFIVVDSECDPKRERERKAKQALAQLRRNLNIRIEYFFVECMIESWLLADHVALERFLDRHVGHIPSRTAGDDTRLRNLIRNAKRKYVESRDWPKLARLIDPERLALASPNFNRFRVLLFATR